MATSKKSLTKLEKENLKLKEENEKLAKKVKASESDSKNQSGPGRRIAIVALVLFSAFLLLLGNIFFWAGRTVTNTDQYVETIAPLVEDPTIQKAIATYATDQIFQNVDVEPILAESLPPKAAFLAPTLSTQLQNYTGKVLLKVVESDKFQKVWIDTNRDSHERLIRVATNYEGDGTISIYDVYQALSKELASTNLSFLAGKQIPSKVGNITIVKVEYLPAFHNLVTNINTWRTIALVLFIVTSAGAIYISRHRRQTAVALGLLFATAMFATLLALRIGRETVVAGVDSQYQSAVSNAYQIIVNQLVVQSWVIMAAGILIALIAWITGSTKSAQAISSRISKLLSGNVHKALISKENSFTLWVGQYKTLLQWGSVVLLGLIMLFSTLTATKLIVFVVLIILCYAVVEILAAPVKKQK